MVTRKILVVDDEADVVDLVSLILEGLGAPVLTARDGMEALEIAHQEHPSVVVTDLMMPHMTGQELCREIRNDPDMDGARVLYLSAGRPPAVEGTCPDAFLAKPFSIGSLVDEVAGMLEG